jgi:uncharacterized protein (TIGR00725 family)
MKIKMQIAVIGNDSGCSAEMFSFSEDLGKALVDNGYVIVCGGLGGVMEAVCKGAHQSASYQFGCTIGILPGENADAANAYIDIVIPTGMGIARNALVVHSGDIIIAIGGGSGTLSELAMAWQMGKKIIAVNQFGGWAEKLAGSQPDKRRIDFIVGAETIDEIINLVKDVSP